MTFATLILVAAALGATASLAHAAGKRTKPAYAPAGHSKPAARDCTPINGRYGYYGNPWCDTGSYRQEDIEFRERQRRRAR